MPLTPGTKLDGYEILGPLGAGGMGEVYRARDPVLKREVAIKVLPAYVSQDPDRLRRFEQEGQAAAALNHPNILAVHRFGTFEGAPYLVSELLDGGTLGQLLTRGPLPVRKAIDYGAQIARGLAAAHEKGIVHRDLKPENIFVTKDGRVKILDFGLAKLTQSKAEAAEGPTVVTLEEHTNPGQVLGTVGYMSPEQVRGEPADARSDIFSLGGVLYEMLTGRRAFRKQTSIETMNAILNEDPPAASEITPTIPPALQRVVQRCLEKSPEQRIQHSSDLAFALEALSDSSSSGTPAVRHSAAARSWILSAVALAVVAIISGLLIWLNDRRAVPSVESVTQLTDDGEPKGRFRNISTDGSRVYFNEGTNLSIKIAEVAVSGGTTAVIQTRLDNPQLLALEPEGSAMLAISGRPQEDYWSLIAFPLWQIPLPAGELRPFGGIEAQDLSFFPDGRIVFARGGDLFVAEKDGAMPRKLLSLEGLIGEPSVSPNGQELVLTRYSSVGIPLSIVASRSDGSGIHIVAKVASGGSVCCAHWTSDGKYVVYVTGQGNLHDLWALPMETARLHESQKPVQLTHGPLSYTTLVLSRDDKRIFAVGTAQRGELVRYDVGLKQLLPLLPGVWAFNPTFSADGKWVAYTSFPDFALWRGRIDGTERLQLTYPPVQVYYPSISPDGKRVAYGNRDGEIYVVGIEGGAPKKLVDGNSYGPDWSPDGNQLVFIRLDNGLELRVLDLRTGRESVIPMSHGMVGGQWISETMIVAAPKDVSKLQVFDMRTRKWSDLVSGKGPGSVVNWAHSSNFKYLCYGTGGSEPTVVRIQLPDRKAETMTSLKGVRRAFGPDGNTQIGITPDGSPVFTRDIGTQEVYALTVKWQ